MTFSEPLKLPFLEKLRLAQLGLKSFPSHIFESLTELKHCDICDNQIAEITSGISSTKKKIIFSYFFKIYPRL